MGFLADLWLPIVLAAVFVFVASSVIHMLLPVHKGDYRKLSNEEQVLESLRSAGAAPGQYMFPSADSMKEMCTPEMQEKFRRGPVGLLVVRPSGPPAIGKSLVQWFVFCLVVGALTAYIARHALPDGAKYLKVFQLTGAVAVLGYAFSSVQDSIWKGVGWGTTIKFVVDGVVYGLLTAGTFAWLWPAVTV